MPNLDGSRHTPPWKKDNAGVVRSNPHIIEKTWAERIDSWTGTEACPVPTINEYKWADDVYEETHILSSMTAETHVTGTVTETTTIGGATTANTRIAGAVTEATTVAGAVTEAKTVGGAVTEVTTVAGLTTEIKTLALGSIEISVVHAIAFALDYSFGKIDVSLYPTKFEFALGTRLSIEIGAWYEVLLGKHGEFDPSDDTDTKFQKIQTYLNEEKQAMNFNLSALKFAAKGVELKMQFGKVDLGL
jgi:hypothetical protein